MHMSTANKGPFHSFCTALLLILVCCPSTMRGDDPASVNPVKVEVIGLSLRKGNAASDSSASTKITIQLHTPGQEIVDLGIDEKNPLVISDDREAILGYEDNAFGFGGEGSDSCEFDATAFKLPSAEAGRLRVMGELMVLCGREPQQQRVDVKFAKGQRYTLGEIPIEVGHVGKLTIPKEFGIELTTIPKEGFQPIKSMAFFDAAGNRLKSIGRSSSGFSPFLERDPSDGDDSMTMYLFDKKVSPGSIEVTYYKRLEIITIPIDVSVGLGLE